MERSSHGYNPKMSTDADLESLGRKEAPLLRHVFDSVVQNRTCLEKVILDQSLSSLAASYVERNQPMVNLRSTHQHLHALDTVINKGERQFALVLSASNLQAYEQTTLCVLLSDRFPGGGSARRILEKALPGGLPTCVGEAKLSHLDNPEPDAGVPLHKLMPTFNATIARVPPRVALTINEVKKDPEIDNLLTGRLRNNKEKQTVKDFVATWAATANAEHSDEWTTDASRGYSRRSSAGTSPSATPTSGPDNYAASPTYYDRSLNMSATSLSGPVAAWKDADGNQFRQNTKGAMVILPSGNRIVGHMSRIEEVLEVVRRNDSNASARKNCHSTHVFTPWQVATLSEAVVRTTLLATLGNEATDQLMPKLRHLIQQQIDKQFIQIG